MTKIICKETQCLFNDAKYWDNKKGNCTKKKILMEVNYNDYVNCSGFERGEKETSPNYHHDNKYD